MKTYKILIVDDLIENISIMSSALEQAEDSYSLYQSIDVEIAFSIAKKRQPSLIITDWDMPHISGIEFIKILKNEETTKDIPIIMATGIMLSSKDLKTSLEAGAVDYIRKPIDKIELLARVRSVLELDSYKKQIIERKNKELAENSLFLVRNNNFNSKIKEQLRSLKLSKQDNVTVTKIIDEIDNKIKTDSWYRFELAFDSAHSKFKKKLLTSFPKLSPINIKLCILLKLEMSTKDIAVATYQKPESVRVARNRLRKKLNLSPEINLISFIAKI